MNDVPQEPAPRSAWTRRLGCLVVLAVMIAAGTWLAGAIQYAREAARSANCEGRLNQLHLAFHNYHDVYGCFPPAYIADSDGKPMHSWRVLILPYIGSKHIYEHYRFDEPWNGPHNRLLAGEIDPWFRCPNSPHGDDSPLTDYVVVVGTDTLFPEDSTVSLPDITDGPENTILAVEIHNSDIHWMEPRDLNVDTMSFAVNDSTQMSISGPHPNGPAVLFVDNLRAYRVDSSVRPETLQALTTIAGGEAVSKNSLSQTAKQRGIEAELAE